MGLAIRQDAETSGSQSTKSAETRLHHPYSSDITDSRNETSRQMAEIFYRFTGTQNTARKDDSRDPAGMIGFTARILFDIQYAAV